MQCLLIFVNLITGDSNEPIRTVDKCSVIGFFLPSFYAAATSFKMGLVGLPGLLLRSPDMNSPFGVSFTPG